MNFRQLRESAGLTQYRLAKLSGVEQTTVSQIELGKVRDPRWSTMAALAAVLNVSAAVVANAIGKTAKYRKSA